LKNPRELGYNKSVQNQNKKEDKFFDGVIWHSLSPTESIGHLNSNETGLSEAEAQKRLLIFGHNKVEIKERQSAIEVTLRELKSPLILILLFAALVSLILGKLVDTLVILAVLVVDFSINFLEAYKSDKAISEIKKLGADFSTILRDGRKKIIPAENLVPGDIIILRAGERAPADMRLIKSEFLEVDQSLLTGESYPVEKKATPLPEETAFADRENMVYSGSLVTAGNGEGIVVATGKEAFFGQLSYKLRNVVEELTPLERRIRNFSKFLVLLVLGAMIFLTMIALYRGIQLGEALIFAVALSVSAIPEGLPAITSIALAVGARKMAKEKAIIRRLASVETLGQVQRLAFDKTGTLTQNQLFLSGVYDANGKNLSPFKAKPILAIASNASEERDKEAQEPIERAIARRFVAREKRLDLLAFRSDILMSAGLIAGKEGLFIAVKGSPEQVLANSNFYLDGNKKRFLSLKKRRECLAFLEELSSTGQRVLAIARKELKTEKKSIDVTDLNNLLFLGFLTFYDPPKKGVGTVLRKIEEAGITVTMITGDHRLTAHAIADEVGLKHEIVYLGKDLFRENLKKIVEDSAIFARVTPDDKLTLTKAWQEAGEVVAVCGDGINDAPALKQADIGIAMGLNSASVARQAADLILLDNDLSTFVAAIREGRTIYKNIQKAVFFLITSNGGEVLTMVLALLLGLPLPLTALQVLWINLVTDGTADVTLALDSSGNDVLKDKPLPRGEPLIPSYYLRRLLPMTLCMALFALFFQTFYYFSGRELSEVRSAVFLAMASMHIWNIFNCRSLDRSLFETALFKGSFTFYSFISSLALAVLTVYHPLFNQIFETAPLPLSEALIILISASLIVPIGEVLKLVFRRESA